jgi:hypothetical protein
MGSMRLSAVAVLAVVLALSSMHSAFAIKLSLDPTCGPYATEVTLVVTEFTNYLNVGVAMCSPEDPGLPCQEAGPCTYDVNGLPTLTCVFPAPLFPIMLLVTEGDESASVIFTDCPAVGGLVTPVNTLAILGPWLAIIGLVGCISTVVVVAKKRRS